MNDVVDASAVKVGKDIAVAREFAGNNERAICGEAGFWERRLVEDLAPYQENAITRRVGSGDVVFQVIAFFGVKGVKAEAP